MSSKSSSLFAQEDSTPSVYIKPDIRRNRIMIQIDGDEKSTVEFTIPELDISHSGATGKNVIEVENYSVWAPGTPTLYTLECTFGDGQSKSIPFGMREFTIKENRFFLNSRPIYVKGFDCTGWCAEDSNSTEALTAALETVARSGFNLIRVSPTAVGLTLIQLADTRGLMVEVEFSAAPDTRTIEGLRNHASIVAWDGLRINEFDEQTIATHDASRVIYFRDSVTHRDCALRPYRDDAQEINRIALDHSGVTNRCTNAFVTHLGHEDVMNYVSTLTIGQLGFNEQNAATLEKEIFAREVERIFASPAALSKNMETLRERALRFVIDGLRTNASIAGYCVSAGDSQRTLPIDELPEVAMAQGQTHLMIQLTHNNLVPRQETPVKVFLLNEDKLDGRADLSLQVIGPTNQVLWKKKRGVRLPKSGKLVWEGSIAASGSTGHHRFVVRLMQNMRRIAESSIDFFVYPSASKWDKAIDLLDPRGHWTEACSAFVPRLEFNAPIHIIAPIGNTIRAYPDNELAQILGKVQAGSVALFFQPPPDWNDLAELIDPALSATQIPTNRAFPPTVHYAKLHPVFETLPSRSTLGETYSEVYPTYSFQETSDEDICGSLTQSDDGEAIWGSNILVKRYGSGRMVFISIPILESLGKNPVADHLFTNLLKHFVRRSVPSAEGTLSVHQSSVEWIRHQRLDFTRAWSIIGMFPYSPWGTKIPTYPPEDQVDLEATYPGWFEAISWKSVHATAKQDYRIDLNSELGPNFADNATDDYGIAYAYAEIKGDTRGKMRLAHACDAPMEVYLNGALVVSPESEENESSIYLKLGKNILLAKIYKQPGPCTVRLDLEQSSEPVKYRWWR